jgi:hypothetical protein
LWEEIKEVFTGTSEEVLGYMTKERKKWMSDYSWQLIEDRKILKQEIIQESKGERKEVLDEQYRDMRPKIKKSLLRDKRKWAEDLADKAERIKQTNDFRTLYNITRTLSGKLSAKTRPVKDINGKLLVAAEG